MHMPELFPYEKVPIDSITIGERHRKDLGDIEELAKSMEKHGQLQPIGLTDELGLVWGERRLRAAMFLGLREIDARVGPYEHLLELELSENKMRLDLNPVEVHAIGRAIEEKERAKARERQKATQFKTKGGGEANFAPPEERGKTTEKVAKKLGVSRPTYEKTKAVVEAAEKDPDQYQHLVEQIERTGKVNAAYNKLKKSRDEERVLSLTPKKGKYRTLIIDPPWHMDWLSASAIAAQQYGTMSLEEIADMDIKQWVAEDFCHVYLWAPNVFVGEAWRIMTQEWGVDYRCLLTWTKPQMGQGAYFRHDTEQVLFGTMGEKKVTRVDSIPTAFDGPPTTTEHSSKPQRFYEIVAAASYEPFGEAFQREARPGFSSLYSRQDPPSAHEG
jgi:N6-adenosine-specific RNA methylase IME4/ParB-like chromosome segregation protein Spo0J